MLDDKWRRRKRFFLAYRHTYKGLRGQNTNNYAEIVVRMIKDFVLERVMAWNLSSLVEALAEGLDSFFIHSRLRDFANGRNPRSLTAERALAAQARLVTPDRVVELDEVGEVRMFQVASATAIGVFHLVIPQAGICTCPGNKRGQRCSHLAYLLHSFCQEEGNMSKVFNH